MPADLGDYGVQARLEYVLPFAAESVTDEDEPSVSLPPQLERVRANRDDDLAWMHEVLASALERGTITPGELDAAIDTAVRKGWDARRLTLTLIVDLDEEEVATVIAGFVAIDLGFPPEVGAKVVATTAMTRAIGDVVDEYLHEQDKWKKRRIGRRVTRARVLRELRASAANRAFGRIGGDDDVGDWYWARSPFMLVAAAGLVLLGISIPVFSGTSDEHVTGVVVKSVEHRSPDSLYYTVTVAYSPATDEVGADAPTFTITRDMGKQSVGHEIRVYYDPEHPERASFNSASEARDSRALLAALGGLTVVIWIAARRYFRIRGGGGVVLVAVVTGAVLLVFAVPAAWPN